MSRPSQLLYEPNIDVSFLVHLAFVWGDVTSNWVPC